jgi:F0F1-type ATP synthase assembly protein I
MKKISIWAKHHVLLTRIIICIIHLLLICIAFFLSENVQFNFSDATLILIALIIVGASLLYPVAKKISYVFQKIILFITSTCFFLITCFFIQQNFSLPFSQPSLSAVVVLKDSSNKQSAAQIIQSLQYRDKKTLTRSEKRVIKKELRKEIKAYKKMPKPHRPTAQDALLIFLIVLSGIGLLFGLAILVCGVSCGGVPALAIVLTLFGMGGIGVALYFIIRKLHKNIQQESKQSTENNLDNSENINAAFAI